jgi:hypothetical protein
MGVKMAEIMVVVKAASWDNPKVAQRVSRYAVR